MSVVLIKSLWPCSTSALYALFADVYKSSEGMSETLTEKYPPVRAFAKDMAALHRLPGAVALVVEDQDRLVAYLIVNSRRPAKLDHTAELNMGVVRSRRGQGIGRLILEEGLRRAMTAPELEIVYLKVRADNLPAVRLYAAMGFEKLAELTRDIKVGKARFDGLLMRRFVDKGQTELI